MPPGTSDYVRRSGRPRQPILRFDPSTYTTAAAERARATSRGPPAARAPPPRRRVRRTAAEMARDMAQLTIGQQGSIMGHGRNVRVFIKHNPNGTRAPHVGGQIRAFSFRIPTPKEWSQMDPDEREDYINQFVQTTSAQDLWDEANVPYLDEVVDLANTNLWLVDHPMTEDAQLDDSDEEEEEEELDEEQMLAQVSRIFRASLENFLRRLQPDTLDDPETVDDIAQDFLQRILDNLPRPPDPSHHPAILNWAKDVIDDYRAGQGGGGRSSPLPRRGRSSPLPRRGRSSPTFVPFPSPTYRRG